MNEIAEQLQEYLWLHVESDIDCLGQSYEFDDLNGLQVRAFTKNDDKLLSVMSALKAELLSIWIMRMKRAFR